MSRSWRNNSITAAALFLEASALYLVFVALGAVIDQPEMSLPFWLVLLALVVAFGLMSYILSLNVNPGIRGWLGFAAALPALLVLADMNTGAGYVPVDTMISGDVDSTAAVIGTYLLLIVVWWRGTNVAKEDVTLDSMRSAFLWGLGLIFGTSLIDAMVEEQVVSGFLVVGFFAVGLLGLSLARFSSESGETHAMSGEWVTPIAVSVGSVVLLGLFISAVGLGGLDDVTRAILTFGGEAGFWILRPVFLLMGFLAAGLVEVGNWLAGIFGSGDITALRDAQNRLDEFHRQLNEQSDQRETSTLLITILKWIAFTIASLVAGSVLYRLFRSRRFQGHVSDVEETRESLFTWKRANDDLSGMLAAWWNKMFPVQERNSGQGSEPATPREFYHGFLALAARMGRPRRDWETPNEHQRFLWGLLPSDPVYRIVQRFQRSHYGRDGSDDTAMDDLRDDWKELNDFVDQEDV